MHRLVIALTTLLTLTAGAYLAGYVLLFSGSTDRAASLVPADAAVYVNAYLQPSAGQQANLSDLIGRLPGFADEATLDDKVDQIVQNVVAGTGLDYRTDLKPWLGDQVAAAAWPSAEDATVQRTVVIVDVKDEALMESALADVAERQGESFTEETHDGVTLHVGTATAWAVIAEMLVVSDSADVVRSVIDTQSGSPSLGSLPEFRAAMASIPSDHLAAAYVSLPRLLDGAEPAGLTTVAAALIADRAGLRVTAVAPLPTAGEGTRAPASAATEAAGTTTLAEWMGPETVVEITIFGLADLLGEVESAAAGTPLGEQLATLRIGLAFGFGLDMDADLLPLLDGETAIALDAVSDGPPSGRLLLRPSDFDAASAAVERISGALVDAGGSRTIEETDAGDVTVLDVPQLGRFAYAIADEVIVLGLNVEDVAVAAAVGGSGDSLAATERYEAAFEPIGGRAGSEAYADVALLLESLGVAETLPDDARGILSRLGTFAATTRLSDDRIEFRAVLTVDDGGTQ